MNARSYRVTLKLSPLDFPAIMGLGESSISYQSEPKMIDNKVELSITNKYILFDISTKKQYEVLSAQSIYEIPSNEIKSREDVYEFYKDSIQGLNEAYQYARTQLPSLHNIIFPSPPIENYKGEIDRIFELLNTRN